MKILIADDILLKLFFKRQRINFMFERFPLPLLGRRANAIFIKESCYCWDFSKRKDSANVAKMNERMCLFCLLLCLAFEAEFSISG